MKKLYPLILLCLGFHGGFAQDSSSYDPPYQITWEAAVEVDNPQVVHLLKSPSGTTPLVGIKSPWDMLFNNLNDRCDSIISSVEFDTQFYRKKFAKPVYAWQNGDSTQLVYMAYHRKDKSEMFVSRKVAPNGSYSELKLLFNIPTQGYYTTLPKFSFSPDSSQIIVSYIPKSKKGEPKRVEMALIDRYSTESKRFAISFPEKFEFLYGSEVKLSPTGDLYVFGARQPKYRSEEGASLLLYRIRVSDSTISSRELAIESPIAMSAKVEFALTEPHIMTIVGTYGNETWEGSIGFFYAQTEVSKSDVITVVKKEISEEYRKNHQVSLGGINKRIYQIDHVVKLENGSIAIIAEEFINQEVASPNGIPKNLPYHRNTIWVCTIQNGGFKWIQPIEKYQSYDSYPTEVYLRYNFLEFNNSLYFFFNDRKQSQDRLAKGRSPKNYVVKDTPVLALVKLDENGNQQAFNPIPYTDEINSMTICPILCVPSENGWRLFAQGKDGVQFGTLTLDGL